jgi:hypothetical protein
MCPTALALAAALALPNVPLKPARQPVALPPSYMAVNLLMYNKSVQDEVKLSDEQNVVLRQMLEEVHRKLIDGFKVRRNQEQARELAEAFQAGQGKALAAVLRPEQAARLCQIEIQNEGLNGIVNRADVQKELQLTDRQKERLQEAVARYRVETPKRLAEPVGEGPVNVQELILTLSRKAAEEFVGSLDAEQRRRWKELTGAPFAFKR